MKTDKQLEIGIAEELNGEPRVREDEIGIEARDGIVTLMGHDDGGKVTLTGTVRSWPQRADAKRAAWSATGVTEVEDRLMVNF